MSKTSKLRPQNPLADADAQPLAEPPRNISPSQQGEDAPAPPQTSLVPIPIPPPVPVRPRLDGWTAERQRAFIEHLADHGCIKSACAAVGMSEQSAYALRRRPDAAAFDAAWVAALARVLDRVAETAVDRAINGSVRARYWKGEKVGEERIHNDRLAIWLLQKGHGVLAQSRERLSAVAALATNLEEIADVNDNPRPRFRIWRDEISGDMCTNAPPPPDFDGAQICEFGDKDYEREVTDEEWDGWLNRPEAIEAEVHQEAARLAFFGLDDDDSERDAA